MRDLGVLDDLSALDHLGPWRGLEVLDLGCGAGHLVAGLAARGARVQGLEPDPRQLAQALAAGVPEGCSVQQGVADALPFPAASKDVVIFNRSLHHVPVAAMAQALREASRVLREGGRLLVLEPDADGQLSQLMAPFHDERAVRALALAAIEGLGADGVEVLRYQRQHRYPDLATFQEGMASATFIEIDRAGLYTETVARRFEAGRHSDDQGEVDYRFSNPIQVFVIPKAGIPLQD